MEQTVVLTVETTDNVLYRGDTFDLSKLAKNPNPTTSVNTVFLVCDSSASNGVKVRPRKALA
jgi:hypothetical protein